MSSSESTDFYQSSKMIHCFYILLLYLLTCMSDNAKIKAQNHVKIIQAGDAVNLTCIFPKESRTSLVWVKQIVGEKPLLIASAYQGLAGQYENDFDKQNRFSIEKDEGSFNLSITNTEISDTATYYCIAYVYEFIFVNSTDLIVNAGELNIESEHQRSASEDLQCSVISQSCAEEHKVYWFRQGSEESPPGVIYTQDSRSAQCEKSSDLNSTAHKCIYSLPKTDEDPAIYYCAVAACGQILLGDARTFPGFWTPWKTVALVLAISNSLSMIVIIFLGTRLYKFQKNGHRIFSLVN
ncbi:novel immune-type receptor 2b isoform X2 [Danio aesculapii]|uniref:novel immune-type receptor 2b isoform X2 n=1 Tax=Danio aesculapii TaxID=1142201 RepID=UPI0024C07B78|nr:novel immune-type receptor 2b isoform X2 [Danio aesculapii]